VSVRRDGYRSQELVWNSDNALPVVAGSEEADPAMESGGEAVVWEDVIDPRAQGHEIEDQEDPETG
jgi:hypothetical protein